MVKELTIQERFDWFIDTLISLSDLLQIEGTDDIGYIVYENLVLDIGSSFCDENHDIFVKHGLESIEIRNDIVILREEALELIDKRIDEEEIKNNKEWQRIIEKAKLVRENLKEFEKNNG